MIEQKITCDVTRKKLEGQDMVGMTVVNIQHKEVDQIEMVDDQTGKRLPKRDFVKQLNNYQFHICHEHANEFMKLVQDWFAMKTKGAGNANNRK